MNKARDKFLGSYTANNLTELEASASAVGSDKNENFEESVISLKHPKMQEPENAMRMRGIPASNKADITALKATDKS